MILILGGTSDSLKLTEALKAKNMDCCLSVVSDYGETLAQQVTDQVIKGRLSTEELAEFITVHQVQLVLDATHPFAVEVSKNAMAACRRSNCRYLRFERPSQIPEGVVPVSSVEAACKEASNYEGKIYLTTGSKTLPQFAKLLPTERLIARVLPTAEVLQLTESLGLQADQIEGLKGPFSEALNCALLAENQASVMITKESGQAGGFLEKVAACKRMQIPCIVITREKLAYPEVATTLQQAVQLVDEKERRA